MSTKNNMRFLPELLAQIVVFPLRVRMKLLLWGVKLKIVKPKYATAVALGGVAEQLDNLRRAQVQWRALFFVRKMCQMLKIDPNRAKAVHVVSGMKPERELTLEQRRSFRGFIKIAGEYTDLETRESTVGHLETEAKILAIAAHDFMQAMGDVRPMLAHHYPGGIEAFYRKAVNGLSPVRERAKQVD